MENKKVRKEIEELFEVCEIYEYCVRRDFVEKNIGGVDVMMCTHCARVLPEGATIEN